MENENKIITRLDAGNYFGLGHLSRCISIVNETYISFHLFMIKSDNKKLVIDFINENLKSKKYQCIFLDVNTSKKKEIDAILEFYINKDILIVDHYQADEAYQKQLFEKNVTWLQLDSHAKVNFYANWVMHGSPGATIELYESLRLNSKTKFLIGPEYCIIKKSVLNLSEKRQPRNSLQTILICFGGGDDRGATLACIKSIDLLKFRNIQIFVAVSSFNKDYNDILEYQRQGFLEIIEQNSLHVKMSESDLAIVAPGMISYECAFLGLPMLLITIADNQTINSKAWEKYGCAINLGLVNEKFGINTTLNILKSNPQKLRKMSIDCLNLVDGNGVKRIVEQLNVN